MEHQPNDLDRALEHHGLPADNVGQLLQAAAEVVAAWARGLLGGVGHLEPQ